MQTTTGTCHCGAVHWHYRGPIEGGTTCNCTVCRRYGVIWAYGHVGEEITVTAPQGGLTHYSWGDRHISFDFCNACGNVVSWTGLKPGMDGKTRIAVNLRLAEPEAVASVPLYRFDGLHSFDDLPLDGRTVGDVWF